MMMRCPNMLMVGAAGRNLGKTTLISRLIERLSKLQPVVALKVTAFEDVDGVIDEAAQHCQTYKTLRGRFMVTRETDPGSAKDTGKLLHAGSDRVYWLRTLKSAIADGMQAVFEQMRSDGIATGSACIVCESNTARLAVDPGLFIIVRQGADEKPSCTEVVAEADRVIDFLGNGWSLDPADIAFSSGHWKLKEAATAIILAGGNSRRMGSDKALLQLGRRALLEHIAHQLEGNFAEVLVSGDPDKYRVEGARTVADLEPEQGPMMGLYSTLQASTTELNWITTCDMPSPNLSYVRKMLRSMAGFDILLPTDAEEHPQPLLGVYRRSVIEAMEPFLSDGRRCLFDLFKKVRTGYLPLTEGWYRNINTEQEYQEYLHESDSI